ncbi:unnamed protein product [Orchesella dallaii]|uniref:Uncharacterized protein n=1 Tax=Orchesella dallaii TaxID=48710 RepID=A0ABP1S8H8_9HEXA
MVRINDENQDPEVLKFNFEHDTRFFSLTVRKDNTSQQRFTGKIDPAAISVNYVPPPRRVIHPREALRESVYMTAQPFAENDVDRYFMPFRFATSIRAPPPPPPAPEIEEMDDAT